MSAPDAGTPLVPTGNPLTSGMGPAAWSDRADVPDVNIHGKPRIVPMERAPGFHLESRDPDPRGKSVTGCDGVVAGTVAELWVDTAEPQLRYLGVRLASGGRTVLLPAPCAKIGKDGSVKVHAITAAQFADVPAHKTPGQVTLREEDQISAYFTAGYLYATPSRQEPLL